MKKQNILVIFEPFGARGKNGETAPHLEKALETIQQDDFSANCKIIIETLPRRQLSENKITRLRHDHHVGRDQTLVVTSDIGNAVKARDAGTRAIGVTWRESAITNIFARSGMKTNGAVAQLLDFSGFAKVLTKQIEPKRKIPVMRATPKKKEPR